MLFAGSDIAERKVWGLDNTTFTFPSSPLLTQSNEVEESIICAGDESIAPIMNAKGKERCQRWDERKITSCDCVHLRQIPLGSTVEVILLDQGHFFTLN